MAKEDGSWKFCGRVQSYVTHVTEDIQHLSRAIKRYSEKYGKYPHRLEELVPNFIKQLPLDFFNPDEKLYIYKPNKDSWLYYSFGPDVDDDGRLVGYDVYDGIVSNGDIIFDSSSGEAIKVIGKKWKVKRTKFGQH